MDLSFQLFSARNFPLDDVLKTVGGLGYKYVEGFGGLAAGGEGLGGLYEDLSGLKAKLDANGLSMPTAHVGLDLLEQPDKALRIAEVLGTKVFLCPWLAPEQRPTTIEGWQAFGEKLGQLSKPFSSAGITFGYHNHDFEFARLQDGRYPMDVLLAAAPDVCAEVDIAWIYRGNADPFPWLEANGDRIVAVHVKDLAPSGENADEDGWADVGHGRLPWRDLLSHVKANTKTRYFVAEHDNPTDVSRFAKRSIAAVNSFGV
ncbi:sugar phosphate isomerase/epimerase [Devosia rhodophyticola]|uniref:Sugar phosphate isomerase/epimerase n=1 Tax=Devosia rhodophyticola TaxID=3026423 RepID=A0ABY7YW24_9HYPH|nr:sugar phosphate isomerase/epimerase [Devosia rhodophyticola]WDR05570.1 sugar phosphate isomerase/epimerase [Devosia rhodophyticola]